MVSKPSMESDTNTAKPKRKKGRRPSGPRRSILFSRLTRVIFLSHLFGLVILMVGSLTLNQYTEGLIEARIENLKSQALLITSIMADTATGYGVDAQLDEDRAEQIIKRLDLPPGWRVRLHDTGQNLLVDSDQLDADISISELDPVIDDEDVTAPVPKPEKTKFSWEKALKNLPWREQLRDDNRRDLQTELRDALSGITNGGERYDDSDRLIVTVSTPVMRVQEVLGVVTLESFDVEDIVQRERLSLLPFIGWAIFASLISSIALTMSLVFPLRDLSRAAEVVARTNDKVDQIPDFSYRNDEIGDLSLMLGEMTRGLYSRIDDIANFAADVAHEIKNPLTSLRSASDTLKHAKTDEQREKLISIIQDDVGRMDRLITDISKASKVDANLAREKAGIINLPELIQNVTDFYKETRMENGPDVTFTMAPLMKGKTLDASKNENVRRAVIRVEDDGPGIPTDNLETIFDRFYTERPKGAQFGSHSGLGLAISRQIVTAHKGYIFAENRVDGNKVAGASFVVNLPLQG